MWRPAAVGIPTWLSRPPMQVTQRQGLTAIGSLLVSVGIERALVVSYDGSTLHNSPSDNTWEDPTPLGADDCRHDRGSQYNQ